MSDCPIMVDLDVEYERKTVEQMQLVRDTFPIRDELTGEPNGNNFFPLSSRRRILALKSILKVIGLDEDRVWLRWISASEGAHFAKTVEQMTQMLRKKGPNSMRWERNVGRQLRPEAISLLSLGRVRT